MSEDTGTVTPVEESSLNKTLVTIGGVKIDVAHAVLGGLVAYFALSK